MDYLDKALTTTYGYGIALALKLEIYMLDYLRAVDEKEKQTFVEKAKLVIADILNSESGDPAFETINRLVIDFDIERYKPFIDQLHRLFKEDMEQMLIMANAEGEKKGAAPVEMSQITTFGDNA